MYDPAESFHLFPEHVQDAGGVWFGVFNTNASVSPKIKSGSRRFLLSYQFARRVDLREALVDPLLSQLLLHAVL